MIALILGGAPAVWTDLEAAQAALGDHRSTIVAANLAGIHAAHLDAWATLHSDLLPAWIAQRGEEGGYRSFTPTPSPGADAVAERWNGSSGLYAVQVALFEMGASAAVLCGIPMESTAGHFCNPGPWASTTDYRQAFADALPAIGGRVRSMGGWTAKTFGRPTPEWIAAVANLKPMGVTRPQHRSLPMHTVTNTSKAPLSFQEADPDGGFRTATLEPGESGPFDINPHQAAFQTGDLKVEPTKAAKNEPTEKASGGNETTKGRNTA